MRIASLAPVTPNEAQATGEVSGELDFATAIDGYRALLALPGNNSYRARALQRLGDLYLDSGEQHELTDVSYNAEVDYRQAVAYYEQLLRESPDYPDTAQVLYQLARGYDKLGEVDDSLAALDRVVAYELAPQQLAEVQFRRGEICFVQGDFVAALPAYRAVVEMGEASGLYEQALLKYAWTLFKTDQFDAALEAFYQLLALKYEEVAFSEVDFQPVNQSKADRELLRDALRGMTLIYALKNDYRALHLLGDRFGDTRFNHLVYEAVAGFYRDEGQPFDQARVLQAFIEAYPDTAKAALYQQQLVQIYTNAGDVQHLLAAKRELVTLYYLNERRWRLLSDGLSQRLTPVVMDYIRELAEYHHAQFQKQRQLVDFEAARDWYQLYLERFAQQADVPQQRFLLAELLAQLGEDEAAASHYRAVAYDYPPQLQAAEAGYALVLAYDRLQKRFPDQQWWMAKYEAALLFADYFSDDLRSSTLLLSVANEAYGREADGQARHAAELLLAAELAPAETRYEAQMLSGHISYRQHDYSAAAQAFALAARGTGDPQLQRDAERWQAGALYKVAEAMLAIGQADGAIDQLLVISKVVPGSEVGIQACFDAATELLKQERWSQSITVLRDFQRAYPNHALQADVPAKLALAYMELGESAAAAGQFDLIAQRSGDAEEQREAALQAATLWEQAGEDARAGAGYKHYIYAYPTPVAAAFQAKLALAGVYQRTDQLDKRDYWYRNIIESARGDELRNDKQVQFGAAKAAFQLAESSYRTYSEVQLVAPIEQNLTEKRRRMKAALSAYKQAADYGYVEYVTAATYRIGAIYADLAKALMASQRPAGLTDLELEQYELLLEEQAYPFEEQAIKVLEGNVGRIDDGVFDRWVDESIQALAALVPAQYDKPEQSAEVIYALH